MMSLTLRESLEKLEKLRPETLLETCQRVRRELGGAEWRMALCLLASQKQRVYQHFGYSNITDFAERGLQLSGKKTAGLLAAARAIEHLPLTSLAFQEGRIGWAKIRALQSVVTPETEREWLAFALSHRSSEVAFKVAMCPREWKRQQALTASLENEPVVSSEAVAQVLGSASSSPIIDSADRQASSSEPTGPVVEAPPRPEDKDRLTSVTCARSEDETGSKEQPSGIGAFPIDHAADNASGRDAHDNVPTWNGGDGTSGVSPYAAAPGLPPHPKKIRLIIDMTPDQFAVFERAEVRARSQTGKRSSRAAVLSQMAKAFLNAGTARSRAKHQIVIYTSAENPQEGWYDTDRGLLKVDPKLLEELAAKSHAHQGKSHADPGKSIGTGSESGATSAPGSAEPDCEKKRRPIPNQMLRDLFARARHRCECCGVGGVPLQAHHKVPVSEGGGNELSLLELVCPACHSSRHELDFATKPGWRAARAFAQSSQSSRVPGPVSPVRPTESAEPISLHEAASSGEAVVMTEAAPPAKAAPPNEAALSGKAVRTNEAAPPGEGALSGKAVRTNEAAPPGETVMPAGRESPGEEVTPVKLASAAESCKSPGGNWLT